MKKLLLCGFAFLAAMPVTAATVSGHVKFETRRGQRPAVGETVVSLESLVPAKARKIEQGVVTTRSKALLPHILVVPVGSTIRFPNEDPISHNLFSVSPANPFDLGFYRVGAGKSEVFEKPGIVQIYCNVHPNMSAVVHVMATPYYGYVSADGAFNLEGVPAGKYRLRASNELGEATSDVVVTSSGSVTGPTRLTIDTKKFRGSSHMNKHGQPYDRGREY